MIKKLFYCFFVIVVFSGCTSKAKKDSKNEIYKEWKMTNVVCRHEMYDAREIDRRIKINESNKYCH